MSCQSVSYRITVLPTVINAEHQIFTRLGVVTPTAVAATVVAPQLMFANLGSVDGRCLADRKQTAAPLRLFSLLLASMLCHILISNYAS